MRRMILGLLAKIIMVAIVATVVTIETRMINSSITKLQDDIKRNTEMK